VDGEENGCGVEVNGGCDERWWVWMAVVTKGCDDMILLWCDT
jgi:hypothetical protein